MGRGTKKVVENHYLKCLIPNVSHVHYSKGKYYFSLKRWRDILECFCSQLVYWDENFIALYKRKSRFGSTYFSAKGVL